MEGGLLLAAWDDASTGVNNRGLAVEEYPYFENGEQLGGDFNFAPPPDMPTDFTGILQPAGAGRFYGHRWGWGNGTGFLGSATQVVDVGGHVRQEYEFSAWLASLTGDDETDYAVVSLEFFTGPRATGDFLGLVSFDGNNQQSPLIVGSMNIEGLPDPALPATQDNWTFYRANGTIPSLASSAAVTIRNETVTGVNGVHGYIDLVSLQVIPEPSGLVLVGILVPLAMCWAVRRRRLAA